MSSSKKQKIVPVKGTTIKKKEPQIRSKKKGIKTAEGELLNALNKSYKFSPKVCESILFTSKKLLHKDELHKERQIEITVIGIEEGSGKLLKDNHKKRIILTIDKSSDDIFINE